ncbi:MAG: hypothetical protein KGL52_12410 [Rhodospirillales bacterium]|nr:hypothetical protein [Rhodospirillales bacterium]
MILSRTLAVLAALLLVGAVALAMLVPPELSLGQALFLLNHQLPRTLQGGIRAHLSDWMWQDVALPLLLRPVWLIPASIGLICGGASLTLGSRAGPGPRRRSGTPRGWF